MKRVTLLSALFAVAIALVASFNDSGVTKETRKANYELSTIQPSAEVEFYSVVDLLQERVLTYNEYVLAMPIYTDVVIESEDKPPKAEFKKSLTNTSPVNKVNLTDRHSFRWHKPYSVV